MANVIKNLTNLQENLKNVSDSMDSQVHHEDVVIFIGTTKSGKSCLINYIIGNKLKGQKNFNTGPVAIQKVNASDGPQIGRDSSSETTTPTRWENVEKLEELVIWDAPGFNDTRGIVQDITNAFYIYKLFRNIKSVKIVLVTDIYDIIKDSVHSFLMLLHSVELILKEKMIEYFSSIVVIFTKVPEKINDNEANVAYVCSLLRDQFLSNSEIYMSDVSKKFIQYLVQGTNIGLFMRAKEGPIDSSIDKGIIAAISKAKSIPEYVLKQVASPSIARESRIFLLETRQDLFSIKSFYELQDIINDACEDFVRNNRMSIQSAEDEVSREILESLITELSNRANQINHILEPTTSFKQKLEILEKFHTRIAQKIAVDNLFLKSTLMEFIDNLLGLKESREFSTNLQHIVQNVIKKINELIVSTRFKINEIESEELNKRSNKMQKDHDQEMKEIRLDLEEKLRLNEINKEEFEKQINDSQRNNSELMKQLEIEKVKNANDREELIKLNENMQGKNLQIVQELQRQLVDVQRMNQVIIQKLMEDKRPNQSISVNLSFPFPR